MSLWDKTPCICGHPRHVHAVRNTKRGNVHMHCRRGACECPRFVDQDPEYRDPEDRNLTEEQIANWGKGG